MNDQQNPYVSPVEVAELNRAQDPEGLATRWTRFAACCVDTAVLMGVYYGINYFARFEKVKDGNPSMEQFVMGLIISLVIYVGVNGYWLLYRGQSLGKWALGIQVVNLDGSIASAQKMVVLRLIPIWVIGSIPYAGVWITFADGLAIFMKPKRCIHDYIAATKVVVVKRPLPSVSTSNSAA